MDQELYGLILAGGQSTRMGRDKGLMRYRSRAQRYRLADLLSRHCPRVYISCRHDQAPAISRAGYRPLIDNGQASEQYGAILTALTAHPNNPWLILACDLPLANDLAVSNLIAERDKSKLATTYSSKDEHLPEPLFAIWEPASRQLLLSRLEQGFTCPKKALISKMQSVKLVEPADQLFITNANTPREASEARRIIKMSAGAQQGIM